MKRFFWIPLAAAVALVAGACLLGAGSPAKFWDFPSLVFSYGLTFLVLLSIYTPAEMAKAFAASMSRRVISRREREITLDFFRTAQWLLIGSGILGSLIGVVSVLAVSPDLSRSASAFSTLLLTSVYALAGVLTVILPLRARIGSRGEK